MTGNDLADIIAKASAENADLREQIAAKDAEVERLKDLLATAEQIASADSKLWWNCRDDSPELTVVSLLRTERDDLRTQLDTANAEIEGMREEFGGKYIEVARERDQANAAAGEAQSQRQLEELKAKCNCQNS